MIETKSGEIVLSPAYGRENHEGAGEGVA